MNTLHSCHNFPAGSREAARVARGSETSLLEIYLTLWKSPSVYATYERTKHTTL